MSRACSALRAWLNLVLLPRSSPSLITTMARFCADSGRSASSTTAIIESNKCGSPFLRNDFSLIVIADNQQFVAIINLVSELQRRLLELIHVSANSERVIDQQDNFG